MEKSIKNLPREKWSKIKFSRVKIQKDYYVSQLGRAKSKDINTKKERLIKGTPDQRGYLKVTARKDGEQETKFFHKEIAAAFAKSGKSRKKIYVVHKDYDKTNNKASNLIWVDLEGLNKYNEKRREKLGIKVKKSKYYKLTESKVAMIKKMLKQGKKTKKAIAEKYNITTTQINRIERGENWGHVKAKA